MHRTASLWLGVVTLLFTFSRNDAFMVETPPFSVQSSFSNMGSIEVQESSRRPMMSTTKLFVAQCVGNDPLWKSHKAVKPSKVPQTNRNAAALPLADLTTMEAYSLSRLGEKVSLPVSLPYFLEEKSLARDEINHIYDIDSHLECGLLVDADDFSRTIKRTFNLIERENIFKVPVKAAEASKTRKVSDRAKIKVTDTLKCSKVSHSSKEGKFTQFEREIVDAILRPAIMYEAQEKLILPAPGLVSVYVSFDEGIKRINQQMENVHNTVRLNLKVAEHAVPNIAGAKKRQIDDSMKIIRNGRKHLLKTSDQVIFYATDIVGSAIRNVGETTDRIIKCPLETLVGLKDIKEELLFRAPGTLLHESMESVDKFMKRLAPKFESVTTPYPSQNKHQKEIESMMVSVDRKIPDTCPVNNYANVTAQDENKHASHQIATLAASETSSMELSRLSAFKAVSGSVKKSMHDTKKNFIGILEGSLLPHHPKKEKPEQLAKLDEMLAKLDKLTATDNNVAVQGAVDEKEKKRSPFLEANKMVEIINNIAKHNLHMPWNPSTTQKGARKVPVGQEILKSILEAKKDSTTDFVRSKTSPSPSSSFSSHVSTTTTAKSTRQPSEATKANDSKNKQHEKIHNSPTSAVQTAVTDLVPKIQNAVLGVVLSLL